MATRVPHDNTLVTQKHFFAHEVFVGPLMSVSWMSSGQLAGESHAHSGRRSVSLSRVLLGVTLFVAFLVYI